MAATEPNTSRFLLLTPILPHRAGGYRSVTCSVFGEPKYTPTGSGGWQTIDRPRQVAATQWFDRAPFQLTTDVMFDRTVTVGAARMINEGTSTNPIWVPSGNDSVESDCLQVEKWLDQVPGQWDPPAIQITGPIPGSQRLWVLTNAEFRDALRDPVAGYRTQQRATLTLLEYSPPLANLLRSATGHAASFLASQDPNDSKGTQQYAIYTVAVSDVNNAGNPNATPPVPASTGRGLTGIAHYFGVKIGDLMALNEINDPSNIYPGQTLKIPRQVA